MVLGDTVIVYWLPAGNRPRISTVPRSPDSLPAGSSTLFVRVTTLPSWAAVQLPDAVTSMGSTSGSTTVTWRGPDGIGDRGGVPVVGGGGEVDARVGERVAGEEQSAAVDLRGGREGSRRGDGDDGQRPSRPLENSSPSETAGVVGVVSLPALFSFDDGLDVGSDNGELVVDYGVPGGTFSATIRDVVIDVDPNAHHDPELTVRAKYSRQ